MQATDKLNSKGHGKSRLTNAEDGSELIASFKLKRQQKITLRQKRTKLHLKAGVSSLQRKMVKKPSNNKGRLRKSKMSNNNNAVSKENVDNTCEDGDVKKRRRRKRKKKRGKDLGELDEASRLQRRTRYLLIRMKTEQNLLDAYSDEGWKGQSREKIKPVKELLRAKKQILNCKLGIRDAIQQLDSLSSVGRIEESVMAPDGSIYHEHIFCAQCMQGEASPDNDIILCDGACNRAFHQKCLEPPLHSENIPPEDQGWFCRICDLKMEILESVNAHLGTFFSLESNWQEIFKEEAARSDAGIEGLHQDNPWPSDDSEDDDYSAGTSYSSHDTSTSTSLSWSLDKEFILESQKSDQDVTGYPYSSDEFTDVDIIVGRRQRSAVDYKQLYNEMFGKDGAVAEQCSEDEDWGPTKRRRKEKESDAANTLMALHEIETCPCVEDKEVEREVPPEATQSKRMTFRIPLDAVEKLRQAFAENELPSRSDRVKLSEELGLHPEKVSKWFKNARYLALKTRKAERAVQSPNSPKEINEPVEETTGENILDCILPKDVDTANDSSGIGAIASEKGKGLPLGSMMMKKKHRKGSFNSPSFSNNNKVGAESDEKACLKKQMKLLKSKTKKDKMQDEFLSTDGLQQTPEIEVERLCKLKNRLENLKQCLLRFQKFKSKDRGRTKFPKELCVMYVPTAVVKEKA
ncbi:hypothetical protein SAY86_030992 [Trapa natans]|uniref:Pathogenesis-related homeodomain protein n=1 Tax=Trapa natans TaxID=22666 RepID=A0AAN7MP86_TRANT|nr:hypothetical protein SAY86_030992 [Trapa natans]